MDLSEALATMSRKDDRGQPVPFSIRFVTLNINLKRKPSKHMHFPKAVRCGAKHDLRRHGQVAVKPIDGSHPQVAVFLDLITHINGKEVI